MKLKLVIMATLVAFVVSFNSKLSRTTVSFAYSSNEFILPLHGRLTFLQTNSMLSMTLPPKLQYVPCIRLNDLPSPGTATSGVAGSIAICIVVDVKGSIFALGDKCPPVNQSLSSGKVHEDGTIQDPAFGTKFSLKTGQVVGPWCPTGLGKLIGGAFTPNGVSTFPVRQKSWWLEVQVDVNTDANNFEDGDWSQE
jgi:nitrite reductase/ring-hydroxylating ferredoxin subunit